MDECFANVEQALRNTRGILDVGWLTDEDRQIISRHEMELQEKGLGGLGKYCNEGVASVLSRQLVCVVLNNNAFRHASKPCLSWEVGDVVIGEEISDRKHLEFLKASGNVKVIGKNFVMYFDRVKACAGRPPVFVCRALAFPEIEDVPGVRDVLSASPIGSADVYLKNRFGWKTNVTVLGTILIGFNYAESDHLAEKRNPSFVQKDLSKE